MLGTLFRLEIPDRYDLFFNGNMDRKGLRGEIFGWGGWTRTNTVLINSEVPYQLDHAPAVSQRLIESIEDNRCTPNAQARREDFYFVDSVGKPASVQERQPPSIEMQFL